MSSVPVHPPMRPPHFVHAWTGGDFCPTAADLPLARSLYREALRDYLGYWGCRPSPDTRSILKNRALHDAYATRRYYEQEAM